eukprot:GEMP01085308.1.p1 GENE.GEMP01085308.1~~GEMP01085308.1.p1  ORF type:complete len:117 (-),score=6.69 GEMP01085308.1:259-609(-)
MGTRKKQKVAQKRKVIVCELRKQLRSYGHAQKKIDAKIASNGFVSRDKNYEWMRIQNIWVEKRTWKCTKMAPFQARNTRTSELCDGTYINGKLHCFFCCWTNRWSINIICDIRGEQ